jgi:hypothetical protein
MRQSNIQSLDLKSESRNNVSSVFETSLITGTYGEMYCTLEQIGKGAFGCVKTAFRRSDRQMV